MTFVNLVLINIKNACMYKDYMQQLTYPRKEHAKNPMATRAPTKNIQPKTMPTIAPVDRPERPGFSIGRNIYTFMIMKCKSMINIYVTLG